ncbi:alpha/beta hydrolase [Paenalkalicoccus suaedae]|uniref:prolyl aminopeptidase n=1 Tax=Paenalkalicoccus suaedae TaxID=2592382 RepID=A0A859FDI0_9BACI|nr:alpha/beta hydrolase [Paenalkalicoccus suaedae]QKS70315.1 alpha/beta hydrolase [Paenalkalicoccus suaedae]
MAKSDVRFTKEFVEIDGHKSGMFIESTDEANPVLLVVHGGPGFPQYAITKDASLEWEREFTVCYWEQRGAGMSYNKKTQGELSLDRLVADALAVTEYLKERFGKEKVYLFGHSWGSFFGSIMAHRHPEHYHAYIGVGQMGRQLESTKDMHAFLLKTAMERGDAKAESDIRAVTIDEDFYKNRDLVRIMDRYLIPYGGGMKREGFSNYTAMKQVLLCNKYSIMERLRFPIALFSTYASISETLMGSDTTVLAPTIDIPVYIVHGLYDYQTSHSEAKRFFEHVEAPHKQFFTFENSAHSPYLEEKERFMEILREEVLGKERSVRVG